LLRGLLSSPAWGLLSVISVLGDSRQRDQDAHRDEKRFIVRAHERDGRRAPATASKLRDAPYPVGLGILKDEQSGLLMQTATTESGYVVRADERLTAFIEFAWPIRP